LKDNNEITAAKEKRFSLDHSRCKILKLGSFAALGAAMGGAALLGKTTPSLAKANIGGTFYLGKLAPNQ